MKRLILSLLIILLIFICGSGAWYMTRLHGHVAGAASPAPVKLPAVDNTVAEKLALRAGEARLYAEKNHFNSEVCFLVDMSVESGKSRFFVYDLQKKQVLMKGLVAHGCCNQTWLTGRRYGNAVGCGCSSTGKYKIGHPYKGKFGLAYKLYGLDSTNSNAYNRFVVLHSMKCVPEQEVNPYPICQSDGCPVVSPAFLQALAKLIDGSHRPVLLWIMP